MVGSTVIIVENLIHFLYCIHIVAVKKSLVVVLLICSIRFDKSFTILVRPSNESRLGEFLFYQSIIVKFFDSILSEEKLHFFLSSKFLHKMIDTMLC